MAGYDASSAPCETVRRSWETWQGSLRYIKTSTTSAAGGHTCANIFLLKKRPTPLGTLLVNREISCMQTPIYNKIISLCSMAKSNTHIKSLFLKLRRPEPPLAVGAILGTGFSMHPDGRDKT